MAKEKILCSIDIGSSKISTLIATSSKESSPTVIGVSSVPSRGLRKGQIVDIDEAVVAITESLEASERMAGYSIPSAYVSIGGSHIASLNSKGVVAVAGGEGEISDEDVRRVIEAARAISIPSSREILHVIPRQFSVDSQEGIKDPAGMTGIRLEVDTHIITGSVTSLRNLAKCISQVGVDVEELVFGGLASSLSTLTDTEKELGVALVDIGGGTCDLCLFVEGSLAHSVVLPIGGKNITNDLAIGLRSSLDTAEKIKLELSRINKKKDGVYESEEMKKEKKEDVLDISKLSITEDVGQLSKKTLVDGIIKPRLTEIFTLIGMEIKRAGFSGLLPSGLVITGGAAETVGMAEVGKEVLRMPVRVASPQGVVGLIDEISDPAYGAGIGLLLYGQTVSVPSGINLPSLPGFNLKGAFGRIVSWLRGFLP